jgi:hypothetical protein
MNKHERILLLKLGEIGTAAAVIAACATQPNEPKRYTKAEVATMVAKIRERKKQTAQAQVSITPTERRYTRDEVATMVANIRKKRQNHQDDQEQLDSPTPEVPTPTGVWIDHQEPTERPLTKSNTTPTPSIDRGITKDMQPNAREVFNCEKEPKKTWLLNSDVMIDGIEPMDTNGATSTVILLDCNNDPTVRHEIAAIHDGASGSEYPVGLSNNAATQHIEEKIDAEYEVGHGEGLEIIVYSGKQKRRKQLILKGENIVKVMNRIRPGH